MSHNILTEHYISGRRRFFFGRPGPIRNPNFCNSIDPKRPVCDGKPSSEGTGRLSSPLPKRAGIHYCSSYVVRRETDNDIFSAVFEKTYTVQERKQKNVKSHVFWILKKKKTLTT